MPIAFDELEHRFTWREDCIAWLKERTKNGHDSGLVQAFVQFYRQRYKDNLKVYRKCRI